MVTTKDLSGILQCKQTAITELEKLWPTVDGSLMQKIKVASDLGGTLLFCLYRTVDMAVTEI